MYDLMNQSPSAEIMPAIEARIFPAIKRPGVQTPYALQFQTIINGSGPGNDGLQKISDDTLRAGIELSMRAEADSVVVLLPYIGDLQLIRQNKSSQALDEGQVFAFSVQKGETYTLKNAYQEEAINYFQLIFAAPMSATSQSTYPQGPPAHTGQVVMDDYPNQLLPVYDREIKVLIGKYEGRAEGTFQVRNPNRGVFAFVVEGAFEVQNRLLENRDGLALWNVNRLEFEALSSDAVLLVIEL